MKTAIIATLAFVTGAVVAIPVASLAQGPAYGGGDRPLLICDASHRDNRDGDIFYINISCRMSYRR